MTQSKSMIFLDRVLTFNVVHTPVDHPVPCPPGHSAP